MPKWIDFINSIAAEHGFSCDLYPPVGESELIEAEKELGVCFPDELREFLKETNGFLENIHIKDEIIPNIQLIWSLDRIVETNLEMRQDDVYIGYMPFNHLLFFAAPGMDGILYGYGINPSGVVLKHIYYWEPIEDNRMFFAFNLRQFLLVHYKNYQ